MGLRRAQELSPVLHTLASDQAVGITEWRTAAASSTVFAVVATTVGGTGRAAEWREVLRIAAELTDSFVAAVQALPPLPARVEVSLEDDWNQGHYYALCLQFRRDTAFAEGRGVGSRATCRVCRLAARRYRFAVLTFLFSRGIFVVTCGHAGTLYNCDGCSLMRDYVSPQNCHSSCFRRGLLTLPAPQLWKRTTMWVPPAR